jgi:hypothetical protein
MTDIKIINNRAFLLSSEIDVFPCSRRGQNNVDNSLAYYDPEARLNTERTNRLHTALNGFTDSFIINDTFAANDELVFVLAGYRIVVKSFDPESLAAKLGIKEGTIYAHLSLHDNISLNVAGYFTEMLYRQSTAGEDSLYLDVFDADLKKDIFVGVSFTKEPVKDTVIRTVNKVSTDVELAAHDLALFTNSGANWELVQTSLLPKIVHDTTENSIKVKGDLTIEHTLDDGTKQVSFKVTDKETVLGPTRVSELTTNEIYLENTDKTSIVQVPALEVAHQVATDDYQLRFKFGVPITIKEE